MMTIQPMETFKLTLLLSRNEPRVTVEENTFPAKFKLGLELAESCREGCFREEKSPSAFFSASVTDRVVTATLGSMETGVQTWPYWVTVKVTAQVESKRPWFISHNTSLLQHSSRLIGIDLDLKSDP